MSDRRALDAEAPPIETDALIIGAGPVGLFQVFELGLLGIAARVIDALPVIGGQCIELYADKPIYDIPGTPFCTGRELIERLRTQIAPFHAGFHLDELVEAIEVEASASGPGGAVVPATRASGPTVATGGEVPAGGSDAADEAGGGGADRPAFLVRGTRGTCIRAKAIVLASGAGAFQPRRLKLDGVERFEGGQLLYRRPADLDALPPDRPVLVIGDEDDALETAIALAARGALVSLLHRRDDFRAAPETVAEFRRLRAAGRVGFVAGQPQAIDVDAEGRLVAVRILGADATPQRLPVDRLLVLTGLSPKLGPIAGWGLALERRQLVVDPATFETSVPGIHAVGDAVAYRGKKRLIVSGFHEATLAAYAVAERVFPGRPNPLEYTTTSPRLHRALGLA